MKMKKKEDEKDNDRAALAVRRGTAAEVRHSFFSLTEGPGQGHPGSSGCGSLSWLSPPSLSFSCPLLDKQPSTS